MSDNQAPFRAGTRQRRAKVGVIPYAAGAATPLQLPQVGMLSNLVTQFRGTVTQSAGGGTFLSDQMPWNLISRHQLNANIGSAQIIDLTGFGAFVAQRWVEFGFDPSKGGVGDATASADIHAAPLANGANVWVLTTILPVSANDNINFETGLINLQAPEVRVTYNAFFAGAAAVTAVTTSVTGNLHVYYEYYEIPDPTTFAMPPLAVVRLLEEQIAPGTTGDVPYQVPRMGVLMQLASTMILNAARSDSFDSCSIKFNKTDKVYDVERQWERVLERKNYGLLPIVGVLHMDFWHAAGGVSQGDLRDGIDTEQLATLEAITTITAGATFGVNNNAIQVIRRVVQTFETAA